MARSRQRYRRTFAQTADTFPRRGEDTTDDRADQHGDDHAEEPAEEHGDDHAEEQAGHAEATPADSAADTAVIDASRSAEPEEGADQSGPDETPTSSLVLDEPVAPAPMAAPAVARTPRSIGSDVAADRRTPEPEPRRSSRTRTAHLRLVHLDPWSVMKTAFVLSIAIGITLVVAVMIIWGVLGAAGVWDSVNSTVRQVAESSQDTTPFDITDYVGASRVLGFTLIAAVIDVVLFTAIATLGAFIYNLAATLIGGVEMTLAEDR